MQTNKHIHIIGGGIAGLSAAYYACQGGAEVTLYESSPQLGGRCRAYFDEKLQTRLDNGNHILTGACKQSWALIKAIGQLPAFHTPPSYYAFRDAQSDAHWKTEPPFHLHANIKDYIRLMRMVSARAKKTVNTYFPDDSAFYKQVITPFCLSALNTQPHRASAKLFAQLFLKSGLSRKAYKPSMPIDDWGKALIEPLKEALIEQGVTLQMEWPLKHFEAKQEKVTRLHFSDACIALAPEDCVVFALPLPALHRILPNSKLPSTHESIINGHFLTDMAMYDNGTMVGLVGGTADWVFCKRDVISTTTSAASRIATTDSPALAALLWQDVQKALELQENTPIPPYRIVHEKRATFEATPENCALRSSSKSDYKNLFIAGDHCFTKLPATIEGAIASAKRAAQLAKSYNCT